MWLYVSVPVMIFVVFANSIVLWLIFSLRRLQTLRNIPLVGLATADLLVGLFWIPLATASGYLPENKDLCRAALSCEILTTHASLFNLIAVSAERWIAIFKPLHYHQIASQSVVVGLLGVSWVLSFGMLVAFLATDKSDNDIKECDIVKYIDTWLLFLILIIFYIVCGIMIFMQLKVYLVVRAQIRRIRPTPYPGDVKNGLMAATSFIIEESFNINAALADEESDSQRELPSAGMSLKRISPEVIQERCEVNEKTVRDHRRKKGQNKDGECREASRLGKKEAFDLMPTGGKKRRTKQTDETLARSTNGHLKLPCITDAGVPGRRRLGTSVIDNNSKRVAWKESESGTCSGDGKREDNVELECGSAAGLQLRVGENEDSANIWNECTNKWKDLAERRAARKRCIEQIFCVEEESPETSPKQQDERKTVLGSHTLCFPTNRADRKHVYYSPDELTTKKKKRGPKQSFASFIRLFSVIKRQKKSEFTRAIATNVVCLCFVLMWAPKSTIDLLTGLGHCDDCAFAHSISAVLAWTNSGINALIYAWRMHEFREALRAIWINQMNRASR